MKIADSKRTCNKRRSTLRRGRSERRGIGSPAGFTAKDLRKSTPSPVKRMREISRSPVRTASPSRRLEEVEQLDIEKFFK